MTDQINYADWTGRQQTSADTISAELVRRMSAALDQLHDVQEGEALPPTWHWLFFNQVENQSVLGPDGHPPRGDFLPPVTLPRRMFAGCRMDWKGDTGFRVGAKIKKESTILKVESKSGNSGDMVFVTVGITYTDNGAVVLEEQQDIVYRGDSSPAESGALRTLADKVRSKKDEPFSFEREAAHTARVTPDPVQLFRYSAVTYNGHRIHYDYPYATGVEMYPGLVVHGTLLATLLVEFVMSGIGAGKKLRHFEFRAKRPTFDIGDFHLHAGAPDADGRVQVWTSNNLGEVAVDAWAVLE